MKSRTGAPFSLKVIAFVFIAIGLLAFASALQTFAALSRSGSQAPQLLAATGALIFCACIAGVGIGLLRLSPKSHDLAQLFSPCFIGNTAC